MDILNASVANQGKNCVENLEGQIATPASYRVGVLFIQNCG